MGISPREMKAWQGFCVTGVNLCRDRADELLAQNQRGRASWLLLGVQVFGQLGSSKTACESYVALLEEWDAAGEEFLVAQMCRYIAGSMNDPRHYFVEVLTRVADELPQDPPVSVDRTSYDGAVDWIDRVFLEAGAAILQRLGSHAVGCGCQACRSTAKSAEEWWREATTGPR